MSANLNSTARPANFKEWIFSRFGAGLSDVFMLPYNFKVWAYPPEQMSHSWVGERVAVTDLRRVTKNILFEKDDLSWGPNNTFQFPKRGGTGAIWQAVADLIGREFFHFQTSVSAIDANNRVVHSTDGRAFAYDTLISTLPLDLSTRMLAPSIGKVAEAAARLKYSSSNIIGIGLRGQPPPALRTKCWMYFPESDCPFYRTTVFSNYSPNNVPESGKYWSLMTETSESPSKPVNQSTLIEETIQGCINTGLIADRKEIVSTWSYRAAHGYPTPTIDRDEILQAVLPVLEQTGIYSRGRFGAWKYEVSNQDHSLMQGVEVANHLVHGIPETTVHYPEVANGNWGRR